MRELRGQPRLAAEPAHGALVARDVRVQQLERHLASEREIAHAPHRAEAARAERRDHLVVVGERPAQAHLGRLARRGGVLAAQREHRAAADDAIHRADHRGHAADSAAAGSWCSALSITCATDGGTSGRISAIGGMSSRGGASPVSALKHSAASCHWSLAGVGCQPVTPLGRQRHPRGVGRQTFRHVGERNGPLPAEQPESAHRRGPHRLRPRSRRARCPRRAGTRARSRARAPRAAPRGRRRHRRARAARRSSRRRSSAGDSPGRAGSPGTTSSSGTSSARRDGCGARGRAPPPPATARARGSGALTSESERSERVDDLLEVPVLVPDAFGAPAPARRQLPLGEVLGERVGHAVQVAGGAERARA